MKFTADKIAIAIVTACGLFAEDPILVADGTRKGSRGRAIAIEALTIVFPKVEAETIARCCGLKPEQMRRPGRVYTTCWWDESLVDEVIGAIVADLYGAQAA